MSHVKSFAQRAIDEGEPVWPPTDADRAEAAKDLKEVLVELEPLDEQYEARYVVMLLAMTMAYVAGFDAGFRIDPAEPDWPVAYIELPTGQVSWHTPAHKQAWDGHTTAEKYDRIRRYIAGETERMPIAVDRHELLGLGEEPGEPEGDTT